MDRVLKRTGASLAGAVPPVLLMGALAAALTAAGCGGSGSASGAATSSPAATAPPDAPPNTPQKPPPPQPSDVGPSSSTTSAGLSGTAPAFSLPGIPSGTVALAELKGKVVLLDFWGTWCIPCRKEMPDFEKLYQKYASRGLVLVGMTETSPKPDVMQVRKSLGLTFPMAEANDAVARDYRAGAEGLPVSVLIDRSGHIVHSTTGFDPIRSVSKLWSPLIEKALRS